MIDSSDAYVSSLGLEAYRVGGSVRDELIGRRPKDADYVVAGVSLEALRKKLNRGTWPLRLRNGTLVGYGTTDDHGNQIDLVLPRKEISTGPGHGDFDIVIDPGLTLREDATRRDFTFNALYRSVLTGEVLDPTGRGLHDLERRLVATTHPDSFRDDPLRMLRALRFVSRGFSISTMALTEMVNHAGAIEGLFSSKDHVSGTVLTETDKILRGDFPNIALSLGFNTGVVQNLFPELARMYQYPQESKYHDLDLHEHVLKALKVAAHVDAPTEVRWALLFHDCGKPDVAWSDDSGRKHYYARKGWTGDGRYNMDHEDRGAELWLGAAKRINAPSSLRDRVEILIRNHMVDLTKFKRSRVHRDRIKFGDEVLQQLYLHRACDVSAKDKANPAHLQVVGELEYARSQAQIDGVPCKVSDLHINGHDAINAGVPRDSIGKALNSILVEAATQPEGRQNSREWQLRRLAEWAS